MWTICEICFFCPSGDNRLLNLDQGPDVYGNFERKKRVSRGRGAGFLLHEGGKRNGWGPWDAGWSGGRLFKSMLIIGSAPLASWRSGSAVSRVCGQEARWAGAEEGKDVGTSMSPRLFTSLILLPWHAGTCFHGPQHLLAASTGQGSRRRHGSTTAPKSLLGIGRHAIYRQLAHSFFLFLSFYSYFRVEPRAGLLCLLVGPYSH